MRRGGQSLAVLKTEQLVRFLKYIKYRMINLQNRRLGYRYPEACKQREIFKQQDIYAAYGGHHAGWSGTSLLS